MSRRTAPLLSQTKLFLPDQIFLWCKYNGSGRAVDGLISGQYAHRTRADYATLAGAFTITLFYNKAMQQLYINPQRASATKAAGTAFSMRPDA